MEQQLSTFFRQKETERNHKRFRKENNLFTNLSKNCSSFPAAWNNHWLKMELDLQSLFGLHVYSWDPETPSPPPNPRI